MSSPLHGLRAWLWQRLSALYLLIFIIWLGSVLLFFPPSNAHEWRALVLAPLPRVAWGLFFVMLLIHAWIGIRDVILDYVKPMELRVTALALSLLGIAACGIWLGLVLSGGKA